MTHMPRAKQQDHKTKTHLLEKLFWDGLLKLAWLSTVYTAMNKFCNCNQRFGQINYKQLKRQLYAEDLWSHLVLIEITASLIIKTLKKSPSISFFHVKESEDKS